MNFLSFMPIIERQIYFRNVHRIFLQREFLNLLSNYASDWALPFCRLQHRLFRAATSLPLQLAVLFDNVADVRLLNFVFARQTYVDFN